MQRTRRFCVRVSKEEEQAIKDAAWRMRLPLSEYVRRVMLREAQRDLRRANER